MTTNKKDDDPAKKLKIVSQVFLQQNSSKNPFGPNYITLPKSAKIAYKYNIMKQYIRLSKQDQKHKQYQQQRYLGTLILGAVGGFFIGNTIRFGFRRSAELSQILNGLSQLYNGFFIAGGITEGYFIANKRYNTQLCQRFLNKYLQQAKDNGFQDYQIS